MYGTVIGNKKNQKKHANQQKEHDCNQHDTRNWKMARKCFSSHFFYFNQKNSQNKAFAAFGYVHKISISRDNDWSPFWWVDAKTPKRQNSKK